MIEATVFGSATDVANLSSWKICSAVSHFSYWSTLYKTLRMHWQKIEIKTLYERRKLALRNHMVLFPQVKCYANAYNIVQQADKQVKVTMKSLATSGRTEVVKNLLVLGHLFLRILNFPTWTSHIVLSKKPVPSVFTNNGDDNNLLWQDNGSFGD